MVARDGAIQRNNSTHGASSFLVLLRRPLYGKIRYRRWRANKNLGYSVWIVTNSNI